MTLLDIGAYFDSKWSGYCKWCNSHYFPGERLQFVDDECVCERCIEDAKNYNRYLEFTERLEDAR